MATVGVKGLKMKKHELRYVQLKD